MSLDLLYFANPMCSWCWGFAPAVRALTEAGHRVTLALGSLGADRARPMRAKDKDEVRQHWRHVTEASGQPFDFGFFERDGFVYDTEPACRALVAARELDAERAWPLLAAIQQAFYEQGVDVTRAPQLVELAEQVGFDRARFAEAFSSPDTRTATAADFSWVQDLGIAGFPTLLAERNGQLALLTNGYQPLERLQPLLGRWLQQAACA